jgi:hypothetical protein
LLDFHHRADLLLAELELVRFGGVLLNSPDELALVRASKLDSTGAADQFRHQLPSFRCRSDEEILRWLDCACLAVALQDAWSA